MPPQLAQRTPWFGCAVQTSEHRSCADRIVPMEMWCVLATQHFLTRSAVGCMRPRTSCHILFGPDPPPRPSCDRLNVQVHMGCPS